MSPDSSSSPRLRGRSGQTMSLKRKIFGYLVLSVIGTTMALPFIWMVFASFKDRSEVESVKFLPKKWHPENYAVVLKLAKDPSTIGKDSMTLSDGTVITFHAKAMGDLAVDPRFATCVGLVRFGVTRGQGTGSAVSWRKESGLREWLRAHVPFMG